MNNNSLMSEQESSDNDVLLLQTEKYDSDIEEPLLSRAQRREPLQNLDKESDELQSGPTQMTMGGGDTCLGADCQIQEVTQAGSAEALNTSDQSTEANAMQSTRAIRHDIEATTPSAKSVGDDIENVPSAPDAQDTTPVSNGSKRSHRKVQPFDESYEVSKQKNKRQSSKKPPRKRQKRSPSPGAPQLSAIERPLTNDSNLEQALRMRINQQELRSLRYDLLKHQLQASQERDRIERQIYEERLQDIQNEQLLLEALAHISRNKKDDGS